MGSSSGIVDKATKGEIGEVGLRGLEPVTDTGERRIKVGEVTPLIALAEGDLRVPPRCFFLCVFLFLAFDSILL